MCARRVLSKVSFASNGLGPGWGNKATIKKTETSPIFTELVF